MLNRRNSNDESQTKNGNLPIGTYPTLSTFRRFSKTSTFWRLGSLGLEQGFLKNFGLEGFKVQLSSLKVSLSTIVESGSDESSRKLESLSLTVLGRFRPIETGDSGKYLVITFRSLVLRRTSGEFLSEFSASELIFG